VVPVGRRETAGSFRIDLSVPIPTTCGPQNVEHSISRSAVFLLTESVTLLEKTEPNKVLSRGLPVTISETLDVQPILGRTFHQEEDPAGRQPSSRDPELWANGNAGRRLEPPEPSANPGHPMV